MTMLIGATCMGICPTRLVTLALLLWLSLTLTADGAPSAAFTTKRPSLQRRPWQIPEQKKETKIPFYLLRGGAVVSEPQQQQASLVVQAFQFVSDSKVACWTVLLLSIVCESFAASLSKSARDRKSLARLLGALMVYIPCNLGFFIALGKIEVSVAYACWSALGTLIVSTAGIVFFGESCDRIKLICLGMITAGVVGLNLLVS